MGNNIEKIRKGIITLDKLLTQNQEPFLGTLNKLDKAYNSSFKVKDSLRYKIIAENLKICLEEHKEDFDQVDNLIAEEYIKVLNILSEMDNDNIDWLSTMDCFSETFILQTELTLKKIKLCDELKQQFVKELKDELEVYAINEFDLEDKDSNNEGVIYND